jgi:hypothetical protein
MYYFEEGIMRRIKDGKREARGVVAWGTTRT